MRRTMERSNRMEQRQKRWSWSGLPDSDNKNGMRTEAKMFLIYLLHFFFLWLTNDFINVVDNKLQTHQVKKKRIFKFPANIC